MTLHEQRFQGDPGTRLTAATSTGGGSTAYSLVNAPHATAITFADDVPNPCHGGTVARFDGTLGVAAELRWETPETLTSAQSAVVMFPEKPAAGEGVLDWLYTRGTIRNSSFRLMDAVDGRLTLYRRDSAVSGAELTSAQVDAILGEWVVVDQVVTIGTTATNGTLMGRVRRLDDLTGTPLLEYAATNVDTGLAGDHAIHRFQLGKTSATSGLVAPFYAADHRVDDAATTYLPDPPVHVDEPAPDQAVVTVSGQWVPAVPHVTVSGQWVPVTLA